ncbi:hypothetical protein HY993_02885 [Candidatus Micrarchaeota archaeon]|nr:hypothetical protein [Candidatus Micrarchaeota archaeon]
MKEFWNELVTNQSWLKLVELSKEFDFTVIGGWAAFLWTNAHKSKDIDFVTDYAQLMALSRKFSVSKNDRLKKYEIKFDSFDADIYLPSYSELAIPPKDLLKGGLTAKIQGIRVVSPEALLALKQAAEISRRGSIKGKKDSIDIVTLLIRAPIELSKYGELVKKYGLADYPNQLSLVVKNFGDNDIEYTGLSFNEFKKWRKKTLEQISYVK